MTDADTSPSSPFVLASSDTPSLRGKTAVIAVEEAILAFSLRRILTRADMQVLESVATEEALQQSMAHHQPDFILLDVGLISSTVVLENPCPLPAQGMCLILFSHFNEEDNQKLVAAWAAQGCLRKPVTKETILACLQQAQTLRRQGG